MHFQFTKRTFFTFLFLGITVFIVDFFIQFYWMKIIGILLNQPYLGYDQQPTALKYVRSFIAYSPWFVLGVIVVVDIFRKNFAKSISFFLGLALVYGSFMGYIFVGPVISDHLHRRKFDSVLWKNGETDLKDPVRIRMVDDLLRQYPLKGMSKKQVDDLLGTPQPTSYFQNYDYVYWLGPERGFISIDSEWLCVKFSGNNVTEALILRD